MSEDFSDDAAEFRCLVPFPDGSESFVLGFEAGMIWQRMVAGEQTIGENEIALHSDNQEVLQRMADVQGYDATFENCEDGWMTAVFIKRSRRFKVVK